MKIMKKQTKLQVTPVPAGAGAGGRKEAPGT